MSTAAANALPQAINDVAHLEDALSTPTPGVVEAVSEVDGDFLVLGAAGKMGPTLCRMAKRACEEAGLDRRVIAVSRFSSPGSEHPFAAHGIETIKADLLDERTLDALPDAPNVVYMAGMKFGSSGSQSTTWAMNAFLPGLVASRFRHSRIVAFSTGNVYPLSRVVLGGSVETDPPGPVGEYAMSCLGRERLFEHFSRSFGTEIALLRLNYAAELRYGVLVDIARAVWAEEPVDVTMGVVNVIWQGDANAMSLQAFRHVAGPPRVLNLAGPEQVSVRRVAETMGVLMGKPPRLVGEEADTALLSNGQLAHELFGYPRVPLRQLIQWVADWVTNGRELLGKPTSFAVRDGKF